MVDRMRVQITQQPDASEIWDDLKNKEFRITTLEETLHKYTSEGDAPRACTVGEPKGDQTMEDKMIALELAVKELAKAPKAVSPKYRKSISEFKVRRGKSQQFTRPQTSST